MIRGIHGMFFSDSPEETRAFFRDKLQLPSADVGKGWLIFNLPLGELGVHPTDHEGSPPSGTHDVSFWTNDIEKTVAELKERGVEFDSEVIDQGYGLVIKLTAPGNVKLEIFQPRYDTGQNQS